MKVWLVFIAGGLVTYLTRASFLVFGRNVTLPDPVEKALGYVAPAAFAALTTSLLIGTESGLALDRTLALAVACLVMYKTRNMVLCLVVGMVSLWLLGWAGV